MMRRRLSFCALKIAVFVVGSLSASTSIELKSRKPNRPLKETKVRNCGLELPWLPLWDTACMRYPVSFGHDLGWKPVPHIGVDVSRTVGYFASRLQTSNSAVYLVFEAYSELTPVTGDTHYIRGRKPGKYPEFQGLPHSVPWNLYDPLKVYRYTPKAEKVRGPIAELNNGRLAMIDIIGFMCEHETPGSVPILKNVILPYDGQIMAPFEYNWIIDYTPILESWGISI